MFNYCQNCKNLIEKGYRYCVECGTKIEWGNSTKSTELPGKVLIKNESSEQISEENKSPKRERKIDRKMTIENSHIKNNTGKNENVSDSDEKTKETSADIGLSRIVLRVGIFTILLLSWSFLWWIIMRNGNPGLGTDLDVLIIFCSPSFVIGIVTIILGNRDLIRMRAAKSDKRGLGKSIAGIMLGTFAIGMISTLLLIRWILL